MSTSLLKVSSAPHIHSKNSTSSIMLKVFIALLPAAGAGVYFYGMDALMVIIASMVSCILSEAVWQKLVGQKVTINDFSAAVTGLMIALVLPKNVPLWIPVIGGIFAIIIVKQFFGGLGQNIMNPALATKAFLMATWAGILTRPVTDAVTSASTATSASQQIVALKDIFIGQAAGNIGETSILAILIGGIFLIVTGIVDVKGPLSYLLTVILMFMIAKSIGIFSEDMLREIMVGATMLGIFFMANDYATIPYTGLGKIIFGIGCGVLTVVLKVYAYNSQSAYAAIIIMNLFTPLIDRFTTPKVVVNQ